MAGSLLSPGLFTGSLWRYQINAKSQGVSLSMFGFIVLCLYSQQCDLPPLNFFNTNDWRPYSNRMKWKKCKCYLLGNWVEVCSIAARSNTPVQDAGGFNLL